jgi:hypothetical protein
MLAYLDVHSSKDQYVRQFRKWGFKKNSTEDKWKFVFRRLEKRKLGGSQSEVEINGKLMLEKKVKKEISRNVPTSSRFMDGPGKPDNTICWECTLSALSLLTRLLHRATNAGRSRCPDT